MSVNRQRLGCASAIVVMWLLATPRAPAYIGGPPLSLGLMCGWSTHVMIAQVDRLDRDKNLIVFRKLRDVKGKWPADVVRHHFNPALANRQYVMDWAEPGKTVVMCALESYKWCHTYVDGEWYAANTGDWQLWNVSHSEPLLLRMYAGKTDRLAGAVTQILAGKEVIVPGMVDGPLEDLVRRRAKYQRLIASLKRTDYNPKRDFVSFGKDDFAQVTGMPGFTQAATLSKLGADVQAIACADFDGDGKPDLCLVGANRVMLVLNGGDYFNEVSLPGLEGGARAAVAADYNGDGLTDLLITTPTGPRLYTNLGASGFRDDTALLPREAVYTLTAAAWIDYDADGWPDILLANGYHGLRLYRNKGAELVAGLEKPQKPLANPKPASGKPASAPSAWFADRSDAMGLGPSGAGAGVKGDTLTVCDVNRDGWPDFLYGAAHGLLFLNAPHGFVPLRASGIAFAAGKVGPVFGDFDGDGIPDLFVPQNGQCKLFRGDGRGRFVDVTATAGDLAVPIPTVTSAAWGDFDNDGHPDLVVGCLRGPNRFFRNQGDGSFEDSTTHIGLGRRVLNTQAVSLVDLNGDGMLDMVFNNEGQEPIVLLGNPEVGSKRTPLTLHIAGKEGVIGSRVEVFAKDQRVAAQEISGGDGRGQAPPLARFALEPGTYTVHVRYSSGVTRGRDIHVASTMLHGKIDERTPRIGEE